MAKKKSGPACSICSRPDVDRLNAAKGGQRDVARRFGVHLGTLQRHRKHASARTTATRDRESKRAAEDTVRPETAAAPLEPPSERQALDEIAAMLKARIAAGEEVARNTTVLMTVMRRREELEQPREVTEEELAASRVFKDIVERFRIQILKSPHAAAIARELLDVLDPLKAPAPR